MTCLLNLSRWGLILGALTTIGCGGGGPDRHQVSGRVTYKGEPVPKGFVTFMPDTSKGNSGPGGGAAIVDGQYRTEPGKGIVGGPHLVRIVGYDGVATQESGEELPDGKSLFIPVQLQITFPTENSERDFELPVEEPMP